MPCAWRACMASIATSGVVSESAQKIPPVCSQRAPSLPKISSQSMSPGLSCETAVWPRSEQPSGGAHAEAALGEVQAVADGAADAVVRHPADERLVDAALADQILHQPADGIVGEAR